MARLPLRPTHLRLLRPADSIPALVIMGKVQGARRLYRQLHPRVLATAALWHRTPEPKPRVIYTASDVGGRECRPDLLVVRRLLYECGLPEAALLLRTWSNCTLIEVRAVRVLCRAHRLGPVTALTHSYHAPRVRRLFGEVMEGVEVVSVNPDLGRRLSSGGKAPELGERIAASLPLGLELRRETLTEWLLSRLHSIDRRGRLERWLATVVRRRTLDPR